MIKNNNRLTININGAYIDNQCFEFEILEKLGIIEDMMDCYEVKSLRKLKSILKKNLNNEKKGKNNEN